MAILEGKLIFRETPGKVELVVCVCDQQESHDINIFTSVAISDSVCFHSCS